MDLKVLNLLNGKVFRMQQLSIQSFMRGKVDDPTCIHLATNYGSGAVPIHFRVITGFTILNYHLVDLTNQVVQAVNMPHQYDLFPGDVIRVTCLIRAEELPHAIE